MKRQIHINGKTAAFTVYAQKPLITTDAQSYEIVLTFPTVYDTFGATFVISAKRADGVVVADVGEVFRNTAVYTIKNNMYSVAGELLLNLQLAKDGSVLTECELICDVRAGHSEANVLGDDRLPILTALIAQTADAMSGAQSAAASANVATDAAYAAAISATDAASEAMRVTQNSIDSLPIKTQLEADSFLERGVFRVYSDLESQPEYYSQSAYIYITSLADSFETVDYYQTRIGSDGNIEHRRNKPGQVGDWEDWEGIGVQSVYDPTSTAVSLFPRSNHVYKYATLISLTILSFYTDAKETRIHFTSGATPTVLTVPASLSKNNLAPNVTIKANKRYVISILDGTMVIGEM